MKISRAVGAAALSVAVAASVAAPAVALTTSGGQSDAPDAQAGAVFAITPLPPPKPAVSSPAPSVPDNPKCAELAKQLVLQLPGISADLTAKPPRVDDATNLITNALNDVTDLQKAGCLPNVPSTGAATPSSACVANVAKVLADLFGLVSDLSGIPDIAGAVGAAKGVMTDVTALVDSKCLSAPKPPTSPKPTPPPTPTKTPPPKLSGVPLPTESPSVSPPKAPLPVPSVPVPAPSAPKLPLPGPSKPGVPSLPDNPSLPGLPVLPSLPGASNFPTAPDTHPPTPTHSPSGKAK